MTDKDFLFHKISEKEKASIKKEAKKIMDSFYNKLKKVDKKITEPLIERELGERKEGDGLSGDSEFIKGMFANAPKKRGDFIVAEKKKW